MRAKDIVDEFPVVDIDSPARDALQLLSEHRLTGLVVGAGTSEKPFTVLPASQVVRFVPGYVQDGPGLTRVLTESMADHAADKLSGRTIRGLLPHEAQQIPVVDADDTVIEVAEVMSHMHSPLVTVVKTANCTG